MEPRLLYGDFTHASHDLPLGQITVANHLAAAAGVGHVLMALDPIGDFRFDRLGQQLLGAKPKNLMKRLAALWQRNRRSGNVLHGGVLLEKKAVS